MEKIICFLNLFTTYQRVYIVDETNNLKPVGEFLFADLAEKLAELSDAVNLNHIVLVGSPAYAEEIVPEIKQYAQTKYSNNDLIVEVMR